MKKTSHKIGILLSAVLALSFCFYGALPQTAVAQENGNIILLHKTDGTTGAVLEDAVFTIENEDDEKPVSFHPYDRCYVFFYALREDSPNHFAPGKAQIVETQAPAGYLPLPDPIEVEILDEGAPPLILRVENKKPEDLTAKIVVTKKAKGSGELLAGATFRLTGADEGTAGVEKSGSTNAEGVVEFTDLPPGKYTVEETDPPEGYELSVPAKKSVTLTPRQTREEKGSDYDAYSLITLEPRDGQVTFENDPLGTPRIHTVATGWDVLLGEDESVSSTEERPAFLERYVEYQLDEAAAAKVEQQEKEAEEKAEAQAAKEAEKMARQLIRDGSYVDFIGYIERYVRDGDEDWDETWDEEDDPDADWYDEDEDPAEEEDWADEDEAEAADEADDEADDEYESIVDDAYLEDLRTRYPHILEFWFSKDGHYYYDYDVDYSGIDYDSMYIPIHHDRFGVKDKVRCSGLAPGKNYTAKGQLVLLEPINEDSAESAEDIQYRVKETIKEASLELAGNEQGEGEGFLDFGELQLKRGRYVVLLQLVDEAGEQLATHEDIHNQEETLVVGWQLLALDSAKAAAADRNGRGEGFLAFPKDGAVQSGDEAPIGLLLAAVLCSLTALTLLRRRRN